MSTRTEQLVAALREQLGDRMASVVTGAADQVTIEVAGADVPELCASLRDQPALGFDQLIDVILPG